MTPKRKVLKKHINTCSALFTGGWIEFRDYGMKLVSGKSAALATKVAEERRELAEAYNALVFELKRCSARRMRAEARLAALAKQEAVAVVEKSPSGQVWVAWHTGNIMTHVGKTLYADNKTNTPG